MRFNIVPPEHGIHSASNNAGNTFIILKILFQSKGNMAYIWSHGFIDKLIEILTV